MSVSFNAIGGLALLSGKHSNPPVEWAFCDGQEFSMGQSYVLYSILGSEYTTGPDTFKLPSLEDIGGCRHIIRIKGDYARGEELPFVEASEDDYERRIGFITKQDGDIPDGWIPCDGRMLKIQKNQWLYSVITDTYGGDREHIKVPNLNALGGQKYIICIKGDPPTFSH